MASISLQKLIDKTKLVNLTPNIDVSKIKITQPDINRPALQLAGYFEHFDCTRVQVIGFVEYTYLEEVADERKREIYEQLLSYEVPAVVFSRGFICKIYAVGTRWVFRHDGVFVGWSGVCVVS